MKKLLFIALAIMMMGCRNPLLYGMYIGKADFCIDMLKMFEPLEGL